MKLFDRVRFNDYCFDYLLRDVKYKEGTTGTVIGLAKDRNYYLGIRVMVKLDEPLVSADGFDIKVQPVTISLLEVIDGDS